MRSRTLLVGGLMFMALRCGGEDEPSGGDDSSAGDAGEATSGGASGSGQGGSSGSEEGGASGSDRGGSSNAGEAGEAGAATGGSSGNAGTNQGGDSGQGGGAGEGTAGAGGQGDGRGTISGEVRLYYGTPVEGAVVAVGSATTVSDANGHFELPDVDPEYDIVMIDEAQSYAVVVRGLTTRAPTLFSFGDIAPRRATVMGVVTGGAGVPVPADRDARVAYFGPNLAMSPANPVRESDASYSVAPSWYGPTSVSGSLFALEARNDSMGHPMSYDGFGVKAIALSDTGMFGMRDGSTPATTIALAPVASRAVSGTLSVPTSYDPVLWFNVGPFLTDTVDMPPGPYSSVVPTGISELVTNVQVHAERTVGTAGTEASETTYLIGDSVTSLNLTTPAAAAPIVPVSAAVEVDYDTIFSWNAPTDSVSTLNLELGTWYVRVISVSSSTTIPDLTPYGIGLPPGGAGTWSVGSDLGATSTDEWIELTLDHEAFLNEHGRVGWAFSIERTFTLAN